MPEAPLLNKSELAKLLQVSLPTVNRWLRRTNGPPALKLGALVRYRLADITTWLDSRRVVAASKRGPAA